MIYEFGIDLRVKALLLSDLKLEINFRILMQMEFAFKDNYDLKVSINHSLKKKKDPDRLIRSNSLIQSGINIRKKRSAALLNKIYILIVFNSFSKKTLSSLFFSQRWYSHYGLWNMTIYKEAYGHKCPKVGQNNVAKIWTNRGNIHSHIYYQPFHFKTSHIYYQLLSMSYMANFKPYLLYIYILYLI